MKRLIKSHLVEFCGIYGVIAVLTFAVYSPVISGSFLSLDDTPGIVENSIIRDIHTAVGTGDVVTIVRALLYQYFGLSSSAFHIVGLLMHTVSAFLVYAISYLLTNKKTARIAAALFTVHPGASEAVSWISGNPHLIAMICTMGVIVLYLLYRRVREKIFLYASAGFYVGYILLLRTPWVLEVPILIGLLDYGFFAKNNGWSNLKSYAWWAVPAALYVLVYLPSQLSERVAVKSVSAAISYGNPFYVVWGLVIQKSFSLLLFPVNLSLYNNPFIGSFISYAILLLWVIVLGVVMYIVWGYRKIPVLIACIYVSVSPSFISFAGIGVGERYFYLSVAFFSLLMAYLLVQIEKEKHIKNFAVSVACFFIVLYGVRTFIRAGDWKSDRSLAEAHLYSAPGNYKVYNDLGTIAMQDGATEKAFSLYQQSLTLRPNDYVALTNIGFIYIQIGKPDEAKQYLLRAEQYNSTPYLPYFGLGVIAYSEGDHALAKEYFEKSLAINPGFAQAKNALEALKF